MYETADKEKNAAHNRRTKLAGDVIIGMTQVQVSLDTEPMTVMMVRIVVDGKCADGGYRVRSW